MRKQSLTLPEEYNGLGYQNLISMVFRLMSFRDAWMRVGKASKTGPVSDGERFVPPLHLVLVEEPEAHLHVQVQQVFVRKAHEVLRNHEELKDKTHLHTQLVVSTHSSHIAHECEFAWLRYFRRLPPKNSEGVPISAVINLSEVFGTGDATARFAARYLLSTHCELFFADAAILVEGAAERMLMPHFIKHKFKGKTGPCILNREQFDRFDVFKRSSIQLAIGDTVRFTRNGYALGKQRALNNGTMYEIAGFVPLSGDIRLKNGWVVKRDHGHFDYGYAVTSHASQGKTVDIVLGVQTERSFGASSMEQFYVSMSRGRRSCMLYTDNKSALLKRVQKSGERTSAVEVFDRFNKRRHAERTADKQRGQDRDK